MRLAISQLTSGIDPAANAAAIVAAIKKAAAEGAEILFTPEMSGLLDRNRKRAAPNIIPQSQNPVLRAVREAAAEHKIWVQLGSLAIADENGSDKWLNRSFLIDPSGDIVAYYDKIHLFDVELDTGENWKESSVYGRGTRSVVADCLQTKVGLSICYDLRFADLFSALTNAGAKLLSVPAAFTVPTGEAHWHVLLRARAIEAGCFVVAAAQSGQHEDGRETYGHSLVVDPWGRVLLDMEPGQEFAVCDIDLNEVEQVRSQIPALANRQEIGEATN